MAKKFDVEFDRPREIGGDSSLYSENWDSVHSYESQMHDHCEIEEDVENPYHLNNSDEKEEEKDVFGFSHESILIRNRLSMIPNRKGSSDDANKCVLGESINEQEEGLLSRTLLNKYHKLLGAEKLKTIRKVNIIFFIIEMGGIFLSVIIFPLDNIFQFFTYRTPLSAAMGVVVFVWGLVLILHGIFSFIPVIYYREHFDNVIGERIGKSFIINIILLLSFILFFSIKNTYSHYLAVLFLIALKVFNYFGIYKKVKYLDEGQYYVGKIEFICLHIMHSIYGAWLSYCLLFTCFTAINLHTTTEMTLEEEDLLEDFLSLDIETWGIMAQIALVSEATIYLAYYKDIFFCLITSLVLAGNGFSDQMRFYDYMKKSALILSILILVFVVITLLNHFEKAFYLKYQYCVNHLFGESKRIKQVKQSNKLKNISLKAKPSFILLPDKRVDWELINIEAEEDSFRNLNRTENVDWINVIDAKPKYYHKRKTNKV